MYTVVLLVWTLVILMVQLSIQQVTDCPGSSQTDLFIGDLNSQPNIIWKLARTTRGNVNTAIFIQSIRIIEPNGMIFTPEGFLLVANQNANTNMNGEILQYDGCTGNFMKALISSNDSNAPSAPRGIVLSNNVLYVADYITSNNTPGRVATYNATNGHFLVDLPVPSCTMKGYNLSRFFPKGLVFGPDGLLYVSVYDTADDTAGAVVRFDVSTSPATFFDIFVTNQYVTDLHRPEGLVFGSDDNLYISSFRDNGTDPTETDNILIIGGPFSHNPGALLGKIDTDPVDGLIRADAQAILFGPSNKLYVPIQGSAPYTGQVRRYNVKQKQKQKQFEIIAILPGAGYLTFRGTDPATLVFEG